MKFYPELYYWPWTLRIPYTKTTIGYWIKPFFFVCLTCASGLLFAQTCPCPHCDNDLKELPGTGMARCENPACINSDNLIPILGFGSLSGSLKGLQLVETGSNHPGLQSGNAQWPQESLNQRVEPEPEPEPEGACGGGEEQPADGKTQDILQWLTAEQQAAVLSTLPDNYTPEQVEQRALQFLFLAQQTEIDALNLDQGVWSTELVFRQLREASELCRLPCKAEQDFLTSRENKILQFFKEVSHYQATEMDALTLAQIMESKTSNFNIQELINLPGANDLSSVSEHTTKSGEAWLLFKFNNEMIILTLSPFRLIQIFPANNIQLSVDGITQATVIVSIDKIKDMLVYCMAQLGNPDVVAILFKVKETDPGPDSKNPESASH